MNTKDFPCRLASDLAAFERLMREPADAFNPWDEMHIRAVVPYELAKPIQQLLEMRDGVSDDDVLKEPLDKLYRACLERWKDL